MSCRRATLLFVLVFPAAAAGCGSAHLEAGRASLAAGNLPVAVEVLDQGVAAEPGNQELRELAILARQVYAHELRREIDRLVRSGRFLLALGRLLELEELARRAEQISMPGDIVPDVERERHGVATKAIRQLDQALDKRSGRGVSLKVDLAACRQVLALTGNNQAIQRTCDRLRGRFRLLAVLDEAAGSRPGTRKLFPEIGRVLEEKNPELIELTDESSGRHNARMLLWVGEPVVSEKPWLMKKRNAFHRWMPRKDRKGRQITETVLVRKSKARKKKKRRRKPGTRKVRKKVWDQVSGEFRVYESSRQVNLPYRITILNLRDQTVATTFNGEVTVHSKSSYYEYSGDPRGEKSPPVPDRGRGNAPALLSFNELTRRALAELPGRVVTSTLKRVE
jgi:hypothetical protein